MYVSFQAAEFRQTSRPCLPLAPRTRSRATCRTMAMLRGPCPDPRRLRSSWKTTSITRCRRHASMVRSHARRLAKSAQALALISSCALAFRKPSRGSGFVHGSTPAGHRAREPNIPYAPCRFSPKFCMSQKVCRKERGATSVFATDGAVLMVAPDWPRTGAGVRRAARGVPRRTASTGCSSASSSIYRSRAMTSGIWALVVS